MYDILVCAFISRPNIKEEIFLKKMFSHYTILNKGDHIYVDNLELKIFQVVHHLNEEYTVESGYSEKKEVIYWCKGQWNNKYDVLKVLKNSGWDD